ncbi:cyclopropane fatty acyl phospholipid synthase [bacterium]|nr:cyclopropane fatty acyl phospholipid synthase [bacterium]
MTKNKAEVIVRELFALAGITINGNQPYDIEVHNDTLFTRLLKDQALGLGESYMDGWWDCEAIDQFIDKILRAKLDEKVKGSLKLQWHGLHSKFFNLQKRSRVHQVAHQHYDIGNDLFTAMLDKRLNYSCAYWKKAKNLDEAQEHKLELICKKIGLESGMTVLDLGCGWGSFAKYAAEKYNIHVTGLNISKKQIELGRELCKGLPVELKLLDYREATGKYDRVLSIGFMEHVGYKNYRTYMEVVNRTLKDKGIAFLHTIGDNISTTTLNAWTHKYIFPNGMLPSISQIAKAMEGLFVMEDWHNFGPDYDKTLIAWYQNFNSAWPELRDKYGDRFYRMWCFYLLSSAGGFRSRNQQLWQIVMTKTGREQPNCRIN